MKPFFLILIGWLFSATAIAQLQSSSAMDSIKKDSLRIVSADSIRQAAKRKSDSLNNYTNVIQRMLGKNKNINVSAATVIFLNKEKQADKKDTLFYILSSILLLLGILKVFYSKYFYNIFRVFFNTSLRQNQLTDLLLQARLPSLIFNIFFVLSAGFYAWSLLNYFHLLKEENRYVILSACILATAIIYAGKFFTLKFIGWVSGANEQASTYIFITFLINKILGVILLPFTIIIIFGSPNLVNPITVISLLIICLLFLSRYVRSYSLLQNQLQISLVHFIIYIAAVEVIPIMVIYKAAIKLLQ